VSVEPRPGRGARVLVVAKAPAPGRTKTRLSPPLTPEEAAELARALLLDTLDSCRAEIDDVALLHSRPEEAPELRSLVGPAVGLVLQAGNGLTDALTSGTAASLAERDAVALVASDVPGLPPGSLTRAFAALASGVDVVLGPGRDGGYWLVALRRAHRAPFEDIPWSTPDVLRATLARCAEAGLAVELLEEWRDVDTPADLEALAAAPDPLPGRRTTVLLRRHATVSHGV
jgi:rSAM/selenodomain-associated transferase 1